MYRYDALDQRPVEGVAQFRDRTRRLSECYQAAAEPALPLVRRRA